MNYRINESKAFVDYADNEMIALLLESGTYYTFSDAASALIADLMSGFSVENASEALISSSNGNVTHAAIAEFIGELESVGILEKAEECQTPDSTDNMKSACVSSDFLLEMNMFSDVADYFMVDPIHEVDPQMGWPAMPPENK